MLLRYLSWILKSDRGKANASMKFLHIYKTLSNLNSVSLDRANDEINTYPMSPNANSTLLISSSERYFPLPKT